MIRYDVYGFSTKTIDEAADFIQQQLTVQLKKRDSSYWGEYYCLQKQGIKSFMLYANKEGEWNIDRYQKFGVILLINERDDMEQIENKITRHFSDPILLQSKRIADLDDG